MEVVVVRRLVVVVVVEVAVAVQTALAFHTTARVLACHRRVADRRLAAPALAYRKLAVAAAFLHTLGAAAVDPSWVAAAVAAAVPSKGHRTLQSFLAGYSTTP